MGKRRSILKRTTDQTCRGKVIYGNKKIADGAASNSRQRTGHANIESYKCPHRSHFHIGHQRTIQELRERSLAKANAAEVSRKLEKALPPMEPARQGIVSGLGEVSD